MRGVRSASPYGASLCSVCLFVCLFVVALILLWVHLCLRARLGGSYRSWPLSGSCNGRLAPRVLILSSCFCFVRCFFYCVSLGDGLRMPASLGGCSIDLMQYSGHEPGLTRFGLHVHCIVVIVTRLCPVCLLTSGP